MPPATPPTDATRHAAHHTAHYIVNRPPGRLEELAEKAWQKHLAESTVETASRDPGASAHLKSLLGVGTAPPPNHFT